LSLHADCFFSSRRRHTRFSRDWSSDVCSSDLSIPTMIAEASDDDRTSVKIVLEADAVQARYLKKKSSGDATDEVAKASGLRKLRSEERRAGRECGGRRARDRRRKRRAA